MRVRRSARPLPRKGWFGADEAVRAARGLEPRIGTHFADGQLHTSAEAMQFRVMPVFDPTAAFAIDGDSDEGAEIARAMLLARSDLLYERDLCHLFQSIVMELFYYRTCYRYLQFSEQQPVLLELLESLTPETLYPAGHGASYVDQYVRPTPGQAERWYRFGADELLALEWPLALPPGPQPPYFAALDIGQAEDRLMARSLLTARAHTEPDETFVTFVRARLNKYEQSIDHARIVRAKVQDVVYDVSTEPKTQYFDAERSIRTHVAAAEFREYLITEFNRQVLARWAKVNDWGRLEIRFLPRVFTAADWKDIWAGFQDRSLSYDDVVAFIRLDQRATDHQ